MFQEIVLIWFFLVLGGKVGSLLWSRELLNEFQSLGSWRKEDKWGETLTLIRNRRPLLHMRPALQYGLYEAWKRTCFSNFRLYCVLP